MKRFGALFAALAAFGLVACGGSADEAAVVETGSVTFAVTAPGDVDAVEIDVDTGETTTLTKGEGNQWTGKLAGLPVGTRNFKAEVIDANVVVFAGEANATVTKRGETTVFILAQQTNPGDPFNPNTAPRLRTVTVSNLAPMVTDTITMSATALDADNNPLTFSWSVPAQSDAALTGAGSSASLTVNSLAAIAVTVTVSDGTAANAFTFTVSPVPATGGDTTVNLATNSWPVIQSMNFYDSNTFAPMTWAAVLEEINLPVVATDADGDALTARFSTTCSTNLPTTPVAQNSSGQFWAAFGVRTQPASGFCAINVEVSDGRGGTANGVAKIYIGAPFVGP